MAKLKKEYKLENIIPMLPEEQLNVAHGMIDDALFMEEQLKKLRKQILDDGITEEYQYGSKPTAAMATYLQVQKQYGVIIRFLADLLPKTDKTAANVNLLEWVNSQ